MAAAVKPYKYGTSMNLVLYELTKVYGEKRALNCVSFSFHAGLYGILGPNGAGKSTMMNLITDMATMAV